MVVVLVVVAAVMSGILAWVNSVTAGPIEEQAKLTLANGIKKVMCVDQLEVTSSDEIVQNVDGKELKFVVHKINGADGKYLGAAVESTTGGFSGDIKVLVGLNETGTLLGYEVLQHSETPGLGAKANVWFQKGAKGDIIGKQLDAANPLVVNKDGGTVESITASTITTRAFLKAVNQAYAVYAGTDVVSGATPQHKEAVSNEPKND